MKIYNNVNKVINLYKDNLTVDKASESTIRKKDEVHISKAAADMSRYIEVSLNSDITSEKADMIKRKIMNNEYKIDTEKLSKAIIEEINESGDK